MLLAYNSFGFLCIFFSAKNSVHLVYMKRNHIKYLYTTNFTFSIIIKKAIKIFNLFPAKEKICKNISTNYEAKQFGLL